MSTTSASATQDATTRQNKVEATQQDSSVGQTFADWLKPHLKDLVDAETVEKIVEEKIASRPPAKLVIEFTNDLPDYDASLEHPMFADALRDCTIRDKDGFVLSQWWNGQTGCGKTHAAKNIATALGIPFWLHACSETDTKYDFFGFRNPQGDLVETPFYKAWKDGGLFCLDEADMGTPNGNACLNAGLSSDKLTFGGEMIPRHKDMIIIGTANTWGNGGDAMYVGTNTMNVAFLNRFIKRHWNYDETFERALAQNDAFVDKIVAFRRKAEAVDARIVVSPRTSIMGANLLRHGVPEAEVLDLVLWNGISATQRANVEAR